MTGTRHRTGAPACVALLLVVAILGPSAHIEAGEKPDPSTLNLKAIELSRDGAYLEAIEIWLAMLIEQGPGYAFAAVVHRNVGRNYQKLDMAPQSWWHLRQAVELASEGAEKPALWLFETERALEKQHVKVSLTVHPAGSHVVFEEKGKLRTYPAPLSWWFVPGRHSLTIQQPDGRLVQYPVEIGRTTRSLVVGKPETEPIAPVPVTADDKSRKIGRTTWILLAAGTAFAIAGGVTYGVAASNLSDLEADFEDTYGLTPLSQAQYDAVGNDWDREISSRVQSWETASWVLWGTGAATLALAGVFLYLDLTDGDDETASRFGVAPLAGEVNGVSFGFTF